jgi:uncharacterized protein (DUF885 family)
MLAFSLVLWFAIVSGNPAVAETPDAAFEDLGARYVSDLGLFSPVTATLTGDHSADDQLDQVDAAARKRTLARYAEYRNALAAINRDELSRANQVDAELLRNELESQIWSLETLHAWAWNPIHYVNISGNAIYGLLARDFATERRLKSLIGTNLPRYSAKTMAIAAQPAGLISRKVHP